MKSAVKVGLLVALPIEFLNFFFAGFPLDTGFDPSATWVDYVIGYLWLLPHYPGVLLIVLIDGTSFEKQLVARFNWTGLTVFYDVAMFVIGYLDTAFLVLAGVLIFRWWVRRLDKKLLEGQS